MTESVVCSRQGAIATITLNKPERIYAQDRGMWQRIGERMADLGADDSLRCIALRGATVEGKPRAFAAGADIAEFDTERADAKQAADYGNAIHHSMQAVRARPHRLLPCIDETIGTLDDPLRRMQCHQSTKRLRL